MIFHDIGVYLINLLSGLAISEVAIKQKEMGCETPTSYKDFTNTCFNKEIGSIVSALFIFMNYCIVAFDTTRCGELLNERIFSEIGASQISGVFSAITAILIATFSSKSISRISAILTTFMFITFGTILIPGLALMQDPITTMSARALGDPVNGSLISLSSVAPIFLTAMIYQNIVPTVVKILSYNRKASVIAVTVGSTIPALMFFAYILASCGGGVTAINPSIITTFAISSLSGSGLAASLSLEEEFRSIIKEVFLKEPDKMCNIDGISSLRNVKEDEPESTAVTIAAILLATFPPLAVGILYSHGSTFIDALRWAGTYGSPIVYGILPATLAFKLRQEEPSVVVPDLLPFGNFPLLLLAASALSFSVVCAVS